MIELAEGAGEEGPGVVQALALLREAANGERPDIGKTVAVIGGGSTATDAARTCLRLGAKTVYLVYRRTRAEMPAHPEEIDETEAEGVRILYLTAPKKIVRKAEKVPPARGVAALECEVRTLGEPVATGRRASVEVEEACSFELAVDCVVLAVGQEVPEEGALGLERAKGLIATEAAADARTGATAEDGVFAGGDAVTGPATVIEAVAAGRNAAAAIDVYLMGESAVLRPLPERRLADRRAVVARNPEADVAERVAHAVAGAKQRATATFDGPEPGYSLDEARREAARCMACGCGAGCDVCKRVCIYFAVKPDHLLPWGGDRYVVTDDCDGCGLCAELCPNANITMVPREDVEPG